MNNELLKWFLEKDLSYDQFIKWYKANASPNNSRPISPLSPTPISIKPEVKFSTPPSSPQSDCDEHLLISLRSELGLAVVNLIREDSEKILSESQRHYPSPVKTPHPAKYRYESPVKSTKKRVVPEKSNQQIQVDKKRVQLLPQDEDQKNKAEVEDDFASDIQPLEDVSKMSKLESRLAGFQQKPACPAPKAREGRKGRRSLDSAFNQEQPQQLQGKKPPKKTLSGSSLSLGDFLVPTSKQNKQNKKKGRRSEPLPELTPKPTLSPAPANVMEKTVKPIPICKPSDEVPKKEQAVVHTPKHIDRENLWKDIAKSLDKAKAEPEKVPSTPTAKRQLSLNPDKYLNPDPKLVTDRDILTKLASVYCYCMDNNLILNTGAEFYLVLQLLCVQQAQSGPDLIEGARYFRSVHNCVFFACEVLLRFKSWIKYSDVQTLSLLSSNDRIRLFSPALRKFIMATEAENVKVEAKVIKPIPRPENQLESVRFQTDTDNNEAFPSDRAFHDFKKQRDLFYEILRAWKSSDFGDRPERYPGENAKKFNERFGNQVQELMSIQRHPINMLHMAKLFANQLLVTCTNETLEKDSMEDKSKPFKRLDLVTLRNLERRFGVTSATCDSDSQQFRGSEVFFKEFIECCKDISFLTFLQNELAARILEQNAGTVKIATDQPDSVLSQSSAKLKSASVRMKIGAKFLAIVHAIPFRCEIDGLSETMLNELTKMREQHPLNQSLDVAKMVKKSIADGHLVATLPWVTTFCLNLDSVALQSVRYQNLFEIITHLYKVLLRPTRAMYEIDPMNAFYLNLVLGELFENPLIPREFFFNNSSKSKKVIQQIRGLQYNTLDMTPQVSRDILLSTNFVYLADSKRVLVQLQEGFRASEDCHASTIGQLKKQRESSRLQGRKIRPKPQADLSQPATLQSQLEINFFHNNSRSFSKCKDDLAEITCKKIVARLNEHIFATNKQMEAHFRESIKVALGAEPFQVDKMDKERVKQELLTEIQALADNHRTKVFSTFRPILDEEVPKLVEHLCPLLISGNCTQVDMCKVFAIKQAKAHVKTYMKENLSERFFQKSYRKIMLREWKSVDISKDIHFLETPTKSEDHLLLEKQQKLENIVKMTADILLGIQDIMMDDNPSPSLGSRTLEDLALCLKTHSIYETSHVAMKDIGCRSVDFVTHLMIKLPKLMTSDVQDMFIDFWKRETDLVLEKVQTIISPMNLTRFHSAKNPSESWKRLEFLLDRLLKAELTFPIVLEEQCLELTRHEWPADLLKRFASCMQGIIDSWRKTKTKNPTDDEFEQLMDWLIWYWNDVEGEDNFDQDFPCL